MNVNNEEIEKFDLSALTQSECNDLLRRKGFFKKLHAGVKVPDEYLTGPYVEVMTEVDNYEL
uniref:Uncharacterized protein n=1 Tax=Arion vulgaris TaxID=1028688 RepID=A0A0B6Y8R3_9EUPU